MSQSLTPAFSPPVSLRTHSKSQQIPKLQANRQTLSLNSTAASFALTRRTALKLLTLIPLTTAFPVHSAIPIADADAGSKVITLPSGLSYYDFVTPPLDARPVSEGKRISVHYTLGTTGARNGWRIDSSYDRDPLTFTVGKGEVVEGLDVGVVGMRMGGRRRLVVPSAMGYKTKDDRPVVMGFAEWQRFKNIYLNKDRVYRPDLVMDITVVRVV